MVGSVDGLISGMNTSTVIQQLMQLERQPQYRLASQKRQVESTLSLYRSLNTRFSAISTAATNLAGDKSWQLAKATSSDTTRVGVTAGATAGTGSMSFTVQSLATAYSAVTSGSVASGTTPVADGPILLTKGAAPLGISVLNQGTSLSTGAHTVKVTQASAAATKAGSSPLAATTTITAGANDTLELELDGVPTTLTLAAGSYSAGDLAAAVRTASGGALTASVAADGTLSLATVDEGSAATLRITGGTSLTDLGLDVDAAASAGTDAQVSLDGHTAVTITDVRAGATFTVTNADGGEIVGTLSGGLRAGEAQTHNVDLAPDATLAQVAEAISKAGAGVSAAAVQVSDGVHRLQLTSTTTGAASSITLDPDAFKAGTLGGLQQLSSGQDARLTIGSGAGAYDVTRSSNTISDLMSGVTMTLVKADPATSVTVTAARDVDGLADRVLKMVGAANTAISEIKGLTSYNPETKKAGPLIGDGMVRRLQSEVISSMTGPVAGNAIGSPGAAGVSVTRDGTIVFDKAKFLEAYANDPAAVEALFGKGTAEVKDANGVVTTAAVPGVAGRLEAASKRITDPVDGLIPRSIKSREAEVRGFTSRIESWDARLEVRERKLRAQFSAMETALGKMQQQSTWLAGQLASLSQTRMS
jgi:flagellar hook-associated protein 2